MVLDLTQLEDRYVAIRGNARGQWRCYLDIKAHGKRAMLAHVRLLSLEDVARLAARAEKVEKIDLKNWHWIAHPAAPFPELTQEPTSTLEA